MANEPDPALEVAIKWFALPDADRTLGGLCDRIRTAYAPLERRVEEADHCRSDLLVEQNEHEDTKASLRVEIERRKKAEKLNALYAAIQGGPAHAAQITKRAWQRADRWRELAGRLAAWMRAHQEHAAERCLGCEDVLAEFDATEAEERQG